MNNGIISALDVPWALMWCPAKGQKIPSRKNDTWKRHSSPRSWLIPWSTRGCDCC